MGRIDRVITIRSLDRDEAAAAADYRAGCLALSPAERVEAVRRLSRRIALLNPRNPRSRRIERGLVRIAHDGL